MQSPKIGWQGVINGVQPRIRLMRSFDGRSHAYLGFALCVSHESRLVSLFAE